LIGINTVADENNRLALRSPASLFDHVGGGHQLKINKVDDNDTASLVFQSDYQGRAEMGTMQGRDFRIRTSADGNQWQNAMVVDSATGIARFPSGIAQSTTGKKQSGLIFLPANDSGTVIFQPLGGVRTQALTTAKLTSISADIMTFTSNTAGEFFGAAMRGLSMVRIWNVTKIPALPAFAKWDTAANQLQVSNSDDIKLWSAGDAIQLGDPVTHLVAIDISPLMQTLLGSAFRQDGLLLEAGDTGSSTLACRDQSPASASNLVYFKFDEVRSFSVIGIYG
jgi:hypothetical protein